VRVGVVHQRRRGGIGQAELQQQLAEVVPARRRQRTQKKTKRMNSISKAP
jgi:hypothetical protein